LDQKSNSLVQHELPRLVKRANYQRVLLCF